MLKCIDTIYGKQLVIRSPSGLYGHLKIIVSIWVARRRQRRSLAHLDERLLRDIGVDRNAAAREAAKPFWRA